MKGFTRIFVTVVLLLTMVSCGQRRAKYVFLFIGDGMGFANVSLAEAYLAQSRGEIGMGPLCFTSFPVLGEATTFSANRPITCSSAAGTALSTGFKTNNSMLGMLPDGTKPEWERVSFLQKTFMKWFNAERQKTVLTFPVETMALLTEDGDAKDKEWGDFTAEMYAEGHSFFTYLSDNADSLSSCCRLRNEITDNGFSYTLGAGGVSTGSKSVLTVNLNRCIQEAEHKGRNYLDFLEEVVDLMHKVQIAYNENLKYFLQQGMLPLFDANYINIKRQYLTIGVNGLTEAAEFMGIEINDNPKYEQFVSNVLGLIEHYNKKYRSNELMFNCEMIPAENVGVKHAKWDKEDGYMVNRECYNSYFYLVEDPSLTIIDKFRLHGRRYIERLTGGSALHLNLEEHLSQAQYRQLLRVASQEGCNYFTFNIPNTVCNHCGHISKHYLHECPECHSTDLDYLTRVIGYLKRVSSFSLGRQQEAARRHYINGTEKVNNN